MELGEVICTPKSPRCLVCPVVQSCRAFAEGITNEIPAPRKKRAPVAMTIAAVILLDPKGRTLLVRDPGAHDEVLFSRMWQFPAIQVSREAKPELEKYFGETFGLKKLTLEELPSARHGVTFRNITLLPFVARVAKLPAVPRSRILALKRLGSVPVSSATKKLAAAVWAPVPRPSANDGRIRVTIASCSQSANRRSLAALGMTTVWWRPAIGSMKVESA